MTHYFHMYSSQEAGPPLVQDLEERVEQAFLLGQHRLRLQVEVLSSQVSHFRHHQPRLVDSALVERVLQEVCSGHQPEHCRHHHQHCPLALGLALVAHHSTLVVHLLQEGHPLLHFHSVDLVRQRAALPLH